MSSHGFLAVSVVLFGSVTATVLLAGPRPAAAVEAAAGLIASSNGAGQLRTFDVNGHMDPDNPFFQDIGTNGRRCVTCHQPQDAWTITPSDVQARFADTGGRDPIFSNNDGSICEGATPHSPDEQRQAYGLLLTRGLIRVGLNMPPGAEFVVESVADPYNCPPGSSDVSVYRRPLPSTNLRFLTAVMWDGRESSSSTTILEDLAQQANDATRGHAAATRDLTAEEIQAIVDFETGLFTAQAVDAQGASLQGHGGHGGPIALSKQPFFTGINDPIGLNPSGAAFDPSAFTLFDAWSGLPHAPGDPVTERRRAILRGQHIFDNRQFTISGVAGLNEETFSNGVKPPASFTGTCTVCHDSPNAGNHSVKAALNIGLTDPSVADYLPVYTLRNIDTADRIATTDPGRAMITGKWRDVGKFKGPILRGLAARAPYFHNGSAQTLEAVVEFYDTRFRLHLTTGEKADLVAFLRAL
jgi:cytochrome c peroxidase